MSNKHHAETISIPQLYKLSPDHDSCFAWLEKVRWNGEPVCPHCGGLDNISAPPPSKPHHYWHKDCRRHFTATTGNLPAFNQETVAGLDLCHVLGADGQERRERHAVIEGAWMRLPDRLVHVAENQRSLLWAGHSGLTGL